MARPRVRPARRVASRRTAALFGPALAAGIVAAVAVAPGWAAAAPTVTGVVRAATDPATDPATEPDTEPTDATPTVEPTATEPTTAPPTESAPPETTPPAPPTTVPAPTTTAPGNPVPTATAPTTTAPPPPPPVAPPGRPAGGRLGVRVATGDVSLTAGYWNADSTVTTLRVTVTNTGSTVERIRLGYTLPAGLTDAGTPGCLSSSGGYRCGEWTAPPGARFSSTIRIRVAGTAWKSMPLGGSVQVTATAPGVAGTAADDEGFAVLFPPGPPVPGISLRADEVVFDISGAPSVLAVRLGNTGKVDAAGRVDVVLPDGVSATDPPAGCALLAPDRVRCELGTVRAGHSTPLRLPVAATPEAQRLAPLAGAVVGRLDPRSGRDRQVQMSFRITAAAALAPPTGTPVPTGSQGVLTAAEQRTTGRAGGSTQQTATALIVLSALLVVLALALATTSLRRRTTGSPTQE
ncbi:MULTISPECIES: hypothetical protein [Micromonospora]|uniref:DUF11 domain-containing protein n=1 Tax=Micromonospora solifontis TaxID=2487138 RepID=A0ABX9WD63_9ACTN|nr:MULTISPECIES: hypothetical protein [Micromonospora]NES14141.1 hypothetical protein [Micromonospora sp. PPF5-17B]NES37965.1 hypothetical protein [Micromonospora solifontis]NES55910.1 hypothetical protein [Micromonospora sp. PPF5-6]RNL97724.1 hypothetical protein EFE23_17670 [Micromonospora solifontis]